MRCGFHRRHVAQKTRRGVGAGRLLWFFACRIGLSPAVDQNQFVWVKASQGFTCNSACSNAGLPCAEGQLPITTDAELQEVASIWGITCDSFATSTTWDGLHISMACYRGTQPRDCSFAHASQLEKLSHRLFCLCSQTTTTTMTTTTASTATTSTTTVSSTLTSTWPAQWVLAPLSMSCEEACISIEMGCYIETVAPFASINEVLEVAAQVNATCTSHFEGDWNGWSSNGNCHRGPFSCGFIPAYTIGQTYHTRLFCRCEGTTTTTSSSSTTTSTTSSTITTSTTTTITVSTTLTYTYFNEWVQASFSQNCMDACYDLGRACNMEGEFPLTSEVELRDLAGSFGIRCTAFDNSSTWDGYSQSSFTCYLGTQPRSCNVAHQWTVAAGLKRLFCRCVSSTTSASTTSITTTWTGSTSSTTGRLCAAPNGTSNAPQQVCSEGSVISGGTKCTLNCNVGFLPEPEALQCTASTGVFLPAAFSCIAATSEAKLTEISQLVNEVTELIEGAASSTENVVRTTPSATIATQSFSSNTIGNVTIRVSDSVAPVVVTMRESTLDALVGNSSEQGALVVVVFHEARSIESNDVLDGADVSFRLDAQDDEDWLELASIPVSIRFWSDNQFMSVDSLQTPIEIDILQNASSFPGARCAFWDEQERRWSRRGLSDYIKSDTDSLVCLTTHLTVFGVLIKALGPALGCVNILPVQELLDNGFAAFNGYWLQSHSGIVLMSTLSCAVVMVILALCSDARMSRRGLWRDNHRIAEVERRPFSCCGTGLRPKGAVSRKRCCCVFLSTGRETMVRRSLVLGVQGMLAVRHQLAITTIRRHLWGSAGWVSDDLPGQRSPELGLRLERAQREIPAIYQEFMCRAGFLRRAWVLYCAVHPLQYLWFLDTRLSRAKHAKLLADSLIGTLALSAFFFSTIGGAMSHDSTEDCAGLRFHWSKFLLIGLCCSYVVKLPLGMLARLHSRSFMHARRCGKSTRTCARICWCASDVAFWVFGSIITLAFTAYVCIFTACLHPLDEMKWSITCIVVVLRVVWLGPLIVSLGALVIVECARRASPQLLEQRADALGVLRQGGSEAVHSKVRELANRAMSVGDLLDFYEKLGSMVMPEFDPAVSTTHDVVRHAIIPLTKISRKTGVAYATFATKGAPRLAEKMVTHNWSNRFANLLAAIFADCLGLRTFDEISTLLQTPKGVEELRQKLMHKLHRNYWICAFSVNQHAGICADEPLADWKGLGWTPCTCSVPKMWDGDECEMNKFDDMMAYLKSEVPGFMQVVAVDENFDMFNRIWCIAELLQARESHLPQHLEILSHDCLTRHWGDFNEFDVRRAQATKDADREFILQKIKDKDEFNEKLRQLVLNPRSGLFALWSQQVLADVNVMDLVEDASTAALRITFDAFL